MGNLVKSITHDCPVNPGNRLQLSLYDDGTVVCRHYAVSHHSWRTTDCAAYKLESTRDYFQKQTVLGDDDQLWPVTQQLNSPLLTCRHENGTLRVFFPESNGAKLDAVYVTTHFINMILSFCNEALSLFALDKAEPPPVFGL